MGTCTSKSKKNNETPSKHQNHEEVGPVTKYNLAQPIAIDMHLMSPVMEVNENLAYNYLVKICVMKQKNQEIQETLPLFVHTKNYQSQINQISQIGFFLADISNEDCYLSDLKTSRVLFNFKTIWIFRDEESITHEQIEGFFKKLEKANLKIKQINYYPKCLKEFLAKFQFSLKENQVNSIKPYHQQLLHYFYPLQYFNSQDVLDQTQHKDDSFSIYIHGSQHVKAVLQQKAINIYSHNLQIRNMLFIYDNNDFQIIKELQDASYKVEVMELKDQNQKIDLKVCRKVLFNYLTKLQSTQSNLLLIHDSSHPNSSQLVRLALEEYMYRALLIHKRDIKHYLDSKKGVVIKPVVQQQSEWVKQDCDVLVQKSRCEEIQELYGLLHNHAKSDVLVQGSHQTLLRLLENIIQNGTDPKYRQVYSSNQKLQLNVFQYPQAVSILKLIGFVQSSENQSVYVNGLEVGMIKLARGDLELGFRRYKDNH